MNRKIIGVTVGTTLNPQKISGNTEHSHSWNDLTDKPFYAIEGETKTLTFNGDISTVEVAFAGDETGDGVNDAFLIKMSDDAPEPSDLVGGYYSFVDQDGNVVTQEITEEFIKENCGYFKPSVGECLSGFGYNLGAFTVYTEDTVMNVGDTTHTFDKGIYFMYMSVPEIGTAYTKELSYGVPEEVVQLDKKFLPKHEHSWNDLEDKPFGEVEGASTVTFDGNWTDKPVFRIDDENMFVKVSDATPESSELIGATMTFVSDGGVMTDGLTEDVLNYMLKDLPESIASSGLTGYQIDGLFLVIADYGYDGSPELNNAGIWFICREGQYLQSLAYGNQGYTKQLDEKFIPDTICRKEDAVDSSILPNDSGDIKTKYRISKKNNTKGATWYFKICELPVNDNGNYASAILSGRIGGWSHTNLSYINALAWNRNKPGIALTSIAGMATKMDDIWNAADLVLYVNGASATAANTATLYVKCNGYFAFDLDLELFQSTASIIYDGTYIAETPSGTLAAQASTSTKRTEFANGEFLVNGIAVVGKDYVDSLLGASIEEIASLVGGDA